jgi:hypothetical protein
MGFLRIITMILWFVAFITLVFNFYNTTELNKEFFVWGFTLIIVTILWSTFLLLDRGNK